MDAKHFDVKMVDYIKDLYSSPTI